MDINICTAFLLVSSTTYLALTGYDWYNWFAYGCRFLKWLPPCTWWSCERRGVTHWSFTRHVKHFNSDFGFGEKEKKSIHFWNSFGLSLQLDLDKHCTFSFPLFSLVKLIFLVLLTEYYLNHFSFFLMYVSFPFYFKQRTMALCQSPSSVVD